jgi:uncharacterized protein (TIGR02391 family)
MPRNPPSEQPLGPSPSSGQARIKLQPCIDKGKELSQKQPFSEAGYNVWYINTLTTLARVFGEESGHLFTFSKQRRTPTRWDPRPPDPQGDLLREIAVLEELIEQFPENGDQDQSTHSDFFSDLDTDIRRVSQQRFKDAHYADSVSAAFRELNHQVKQEYKKRKNLELDGADLMHTAFSPKNPIFFLADLSEESGRNIQQGFMELFAGSMIGIRNPHAHENLELDSEGAKHFLYLASLLMKKFKTAR